MIEETLVFEGHDIRGEAYYVTLQEYHRYKDTTDTQFYFALFQCSNQKRKAFAETALHNGILKIDWIETADTDGWGIGSILLQAIMKTAEDRGISRIYGWMSAITNTPAKLVRLHDFYERFGAIFTYDELGGHFLIRQ